MHVEAQPGDPTSVGTYSWPGISGVRFWVDPSQALVGIYMRQVLQGGQVITEFGQIYSTFQELVYRALVD